MMAWQDNSPIVSPRMIFVATTTTTIIIILNNNVVAIVYVIYDVVRVWGYPLQRRLDTMDNTTNWEETKMGVSGTIPIEKNNPIWSPHLFDVQETNGDQPKIARDTTGDTTGSSSSSGSGSFLWCVLYMERKMVTPTAVRNPISRTSLLASGFCPCDCVLQENWNWLKICDGCVCYFMFYR
jgi:hypothetical protein